MSDEKKIIIDEDWKAQVQAEKEAARQDAKTQAAGKAASGADSVGQSTDAADEAGAAVSAAGASGAPADIPMPPASLDLLLTSLATEALITLGQVPHPATGKAQVSRQHAKYLIDTIDMLCEKTKGNVTKEEEQLFDQLLHQLRMAFVALAASAESDTTNPSSAPS